MAGASLGFQNRRGVLRDSLGGFDSHRLPPFYLEIISVDRGLSRFVGMSKF